MAGAGRHASGGTNDTPGGGKPKNDPVKPKPKGGGGGGGGGNGGIDGIDEQQMAADYGFALAFMNSDPELKALFKKAVKNTWDPNMFIARLRATKWFRKRSASVRNAIMMETSDPATYKVKVNQMYYRISDVWGKAYGQGTIPHKQLKAWAETAFRMGWSEEQLLNQMGNAVGFQKLLRSKKLGGQAAQLLMQTEELARQYGVSVGMGWKANNIKRILTGNDTEAGIQMRIREMAKNKYKAFADRIEAGQTVAEIADPYVQQMAELLEMNPNRVHLQGSLVQKALTYRNKDGVPVAMDMHDFADHVRRDSRWQYTDNAKREVSKVAGNLLRSFGLVS